MDAPGGIATQSRFRIEPRTYIIALCFLCTLICYFERVGFSIAYTAIADATGVDESTKGGVLSAFYYGYATSQILGGAMAAKYGGKLVLIASYLTWSVLTAGICYFTESTVLVSVFRVLIGCSQGVFIPSIHTILAKWVAPHERARSTSMVTSGMYLGSATSMIVLPSVNQALGPVGVLRVSMCAGFAWVALWWRLGSDSPAASKTDAAERLEEGGAYEVGSDKEDKGSTKIPWGRLLRCPSVVTISVNNFAFHYALYVVMNWLPTYFSHFLKSDLSKMGNIKMLPYIMMFVSSNVGGFTGDWLILRRGKSVAWSRKAVNTVGFVGVAGAIMLMPTARSVNAGILYSTLTLAACGFSRGGFSVNHMDIAPKYAGVVMGISNTAGTLAGVTGVFLTGVVLDGAGGSDSAAGWGAALAIPAVLGILGTAHFCVYARGEKVFD